jgi:hypothetical protein
MGEISVCGHFHTSEESKGIFFGRKPFAFAYSIFYQNFYILTTKKRLSAQEVRTVLVIKISRAAFRRALRRIQCASLLAMAALIAGNEASLWCNGVTFIGCICCLCVGCLCDWLLGDKEASGCSGESQPDDQKMYVTK